MSNIWHYKILGSQSFCALGSEAKGDEMKSRVEEEVGNETEEEVADLAADIKWQRTSELSMDLEKCLIR